MRGLEELVRDGQTNAFVEASRISLALGIYRCAQITSIPLEAPVTITTLLAAMFDVTEIGRAVD